MALASKPKHTVHHKKRHGHHHKRGKNYLESYRPYIPMFAVVGLGALINQWWYQGGINSGAGANSGAAVTLPYARIQWLTGSYTENIFLAALAITAIAFAVFIGLHWRRLHRVINKGEAYIITHPWVDVIIVAVFTAGYVLTRSATL